MNIDPIKVEFFYKKESEKIKFNWFCYEYAYALYSKIRSSHKLIRFRNNNTQDQIAAFCVHFSLAMKKSILDTLSGRTAMTILDEDYVYSFYPNISPLQVGKLLIVAGEAWDEQLSICECCPTRCISEMYEKCDMFDRIDEDGFLF